MGDYNLLTLINFGFKKWKGMSNISLFYLVKASGHPRRLRIASHAMYRQRYAWGIGSFVRIYVCSLQGRSSAKAHVVFPRSRWRFFQIVLGIISRTQYKYVHLRRKRNNNPEKICNTGLNETSTVLCIRSYIFYDQWYR